MIFVIVPSIRKSEPVMVRKISPVREDDVSTFAMAVCGTYLLRMTGITAGSPVNPASSTAATVRT